MSFDLNVPGNKTPLQLWSPDRMHFRGGGVPKPRLSSIPRPDQHGEPSKQPRSAPSASDSAVHARPRALASLYVPVICHRDCRSGLRVPPPPGLFLLKSALPHTTDTLSEIRGKCRPSAGRKDSRSGGCWPSGPGSLADSAWGSSDSWSVLMEDGIPFEAASGPRHPTRQAGSLLSPPAPQIHTGIPTPRTSEGAAFGDRVPPEVKAKRGR